jgi:hypothetical protein
MARAGDYFRIIKKVIKGLLLLVIGGHCAVYVRLTHLKKKKADSHQMK